jgi:hypothetical protein
MAYHQARSLRHITCRLKASALSVLSLCKTLRPGWRRGFLRIGSSVPLSSAWAKPEASKSSNAPKHNHVHEVFKKLCNPAGISFPAITHAIDGADEGLFFIQRLQFTAQVLDMAVDSAIRHHAVIVIQVIEQLFAREDLPRFAGEGFQQTKFRWR